MFIGKPHTGGKVSAMTRRILSRTVGIMVAGQLAALAAAAPATAGMLEHKTVFDVMFGALTIGTATFDIRFDDENYILDASGKTVGLAELFAPGAGKVESKGRIVSDKVVAERHEVVFVEKSKKSRLEMEFEDGGVKSVRLDPDKRKKKRGPKWVAISEEQLHSVVDPASSIIIPVDLTRAGDPRAVCDRRLNVYDGDTRYDIALRYKATRPVSTQGYDGYAYVCQLRYIPVSGHKKQQRNIEYMRKNEGMEIWLAPMAQTNLFTPIRIEVPTWIGRVSAVPAFFGAVSHCQAAPCDSANVLETRADNR